MRGVMLGGSEEMGRKLGLYLTKIHCIYVWNYEKKIHRVINQCAGKERDECNVAMNQNWSSNQELEEGMHKFSSRASSGSSTYQSVPPAEISGLHNSQRMPWCVITYSSQRKQLDPVTVSIYRWGKWRGYTVSVGKGRTSLVCQLWSSSLNFVCGN